jgi:acyl carrier protein
LTSLHSDDLNDDLNDDLDNDLDDDPDNGLMAQVRQIWSEVLDVDTVPLDVNFFDAGGDSLLFIVLVERINRTMGRELEAAELFAHGTVRSQMRMLSGLSDEVEPRERRGLLGRARRDEG